MNKNRLIGATCALLLLTDTALQAQTLKLASIAPEGSSWMKDMRAGAQLIDERTDGRVKLKFFAGGVQGNDKQVQRKMRTGQLHGGAFTSGSMNMFQQDADLLSLPMIFQNHDEARHVRQELEPELRRRLEEAGYVNFGFAGGGFAYMMSNRPLRTREDLSGQKVWIPEGDPAGFAALRALGVAPVVMPVTDVMTGLQTELLDSVTVPPVGAVVFQWHTRLSWITDVPVAYIYAALLVDKRAFSRLSDPDQAVVREVMEDIYRQFDESGDRENANAMQALLESGLKQAETEASEVNEWRGIVRASHESLAGDGVFDPELYRRMQDILTAYRQ
jgi:TRAP-type C4-dicarboxylate transport system substrate-binding protein